MTSKPKRKSSKKSCVNVRKKDGMDDLQRGYDGISDRFKRVLSFTVMAVILFFWYFSLSNIRYYIYIHIGYTTFGNLWQTLISVVSSLVYAYLIVGLIKIKLLNVRLVLILTFTMVSLAVITWFIFPIPTM